RSPRREADNAHARAGGLHRRTAGWAVQAQSLSVLTQAGIRDSGSGIRCRRGGPSGPPRDTIRPPQQCHCRSVLASARTKSPAHSAPAAWVRCTALKVLPELFAADPERLARFEREAHVLAALQHPNIGAIYGLEDGPAEAGPYIRALVLELVEGETLGDRIARGPIPLDEALPIAKQITDALEAAPIVVVMNWAAGMNK